MTTRWTGILAAAALCGACLAQDTTPAPDSSAAPPTQQTETQQTAPSPSNVSPPAASQPAPPQSARSTQAPASSSTRIAPGSVIPVQLTKSIDAKKVKTGDPVEAKVTQDLKAESGQVILPKDTRVVGHVTGAQARSKEQKESQIGIAFDHAVMKNGGDVQLPMSIQAIIAPAGLNSNNNSAVNNTSGDNANQSPSSPGGGMSGNGAGRPSGMGAGSPGQVPDSSTNSNRPSDTQSRANAQPPINGNTQGVVGISNLKLSGEPNASQGSIVSSEKNNVKLDSGTLMLLRVNQ